MSTQKVKFSVRADTLVKPFDGPYLCNFPDGAPPALNTLVGMAMENTDKKLKSEEGNNHARELHLGKPGVDDVFWYGRNFKKKRSLLDQPQKKYAIGVFRPDASKTIDLYAVDHLFDMKQKVKDSQLLKAADLADLSDDADYQARKVSLVTLFGGRKRQSKMRNAMNNKVDLAVNPNAIASMKKAVAVLPNADEKAQAVMAGVKMLPPFDTETTDKAQVYPLEGLLPEAVMANYATKVDDFFGPNRAEYVPKFAVAIYRTLAGLSKAARAQQCSVLLYYCALLKTYKQRIGLYSNMDLHVKVFGRETGLNLFDLDKEIVTAHISSNFMAKVNRNRKNRGLSLDTFHQQKLVVHLCILTLVLTNFSLDPALKDEFRADIRLSKKELKQAYMMVGAYETKGKKTVLTAPLKLPQLKDRSRF